MTRSERNLMTTDYANTGYRYWLNSPHIYGFVASNGYNASQMFFVNASGTLDANNSTKSHAIRPVITLAPINYITSGNGTYTTPYVVGPLVTRTNYDN